MTFRYLRRGGIRFVRVGRVQVSFCVTRRDPAAPRLDTEGLAVELCAAIVLGAVPGILWGTIAASIFA